MILALLPLVLMLMFAAQPWSATASAPTVPSSLAAATSSLVDAGALGQFVGTAVAPGASSVIPDLLSVAPPEPVAPAPTPIDTADPFVRDEAPVPGAPAIGLLGVGSDVPSAAASGRSSVPFPQRPAGAMTGSAFLQATASLSAADREAAIYREIAAGNVPDFLRRTHPVTVTVRDGSGRERRGTFHVLPDYLAIGTDADFVRIPMWPRTAQRLASHFGCSLPTRRMVDAVWQAATYKLAPRPLTPSSQMSSNDYYRRANALVDQELGGRPLGPLTAGDKKDIVLTNRLASNPGRVAIYGWHRTSGSPIQPLSTVHGATYVDYSHGARLVVGTMDVDGRAMPVASVLTSSELAGLLSDEGPLTVTAYPS